MIALTWQPPNLVLGRRDSGSSDAEILRGSGQEPLARAS
jgi:hypothetical protein